MTPEEFKEQNPDLHAKIMALNTELSVAGAELHVDLPGNQPIPAAPVDLLAVKPATAEVAKAQVNASVLDLLTGTGFVLVAFGVPKPQWLEHALTPNGLIAVGMIVVFLRRAWSWRGALIKSVWEIREKWVALHLPSNTTVAEVKRITTQRVEIQTAQAAVKAGNQ